MQIDLSLFMSDRQFGYFGHWKHLLSLLHYREFWGRRQGGKGGGADGGGVGNRKKDNRVHCRRSDWLHDGKMGIQKNMESKEAFSCEGDFYQIPAMGDCAASYIPVSGCG